MFHRSPPRFACLLLVLALTSCQVPVAAPMSVPDLLREHRFQEAYDRLIAAEAASPMNWVLKRQLALTLGGWFEFSKTGEPVVVLGLGRPVEAYRKFYSDPHTSYRIWATRPDAKKYTLEWYRFLWECFWFAKQAGEQGTRFAGVAAKFYRLAGSTDDFASLRAMGVEGDEIYRCFQFHR